MIRTAILVLAAAVAFSSSASASADSEPVADVVLRASGDEQHGDLWSVTETSGNGNSCSVGHGDGIPTPPKRALELRRDPFRGRLIIERADEPRVRLDAYNELDEQGTPDYESGQRIRWKLRAVPSEERPRRWVVTFRTAASDHVYLDLTASWPDPCGRDSGSYVFHLARASAR